MSSWDGAAEERDGTLHLNGTVTSKAEKNAIRDALKTVSECRDEVLADIEVKPRPGFDAPVSSVKTYTAQSSDTLSKISREFYGDADEYMTIFEANKDWLTDPDVIEPCQVLKIPAAKRQLT